MYVLEESHLIEDTIEDASVLSAYRELRKHEHSNHRSLFIDKILGNEKCITLTEILLEFYKANGFSISEPATQDKRFTVEQVEEIYRKLDLRQGDVASFALTISAALTQLFVIDNFVGPTDDKIMHRHYDDLPTIFQEIQAQVRYTSLTNDGSEIYHLTENPWLLRTVQLYWNLLNSLRCPRRLLELEFLVWKHRYLTISYMIFLEPVESIVSELRKLQEYIFDHHIINDIKENKTELVRFDVVEICCELVQSALLRDGTTFSRKFLDYAFELSGLSVEHTGVLGKRTKFQQNNIPQLVVKVKDDLSEQVFRQEGLLLDEEVQSLKDIVLEDDTLLPDIAFITQDDNGQPVSNVASPKISVSAQILMLNKLDFMLKTDVMEESLKDEWTLAYLRSIISSANVWCIKYKSLALRSTVERRNMRKMDRSLLQMEELIKVTSSHLDSSHKRIRLFYSSLPHSRWQLQKNLGDISIDLALFKNALEVYSRIEFWEGIIKCYSALGLTTKAEKVILQELEKNETPYLYCLLGDATENIDHYEKSWLVSKGRFARAKKSIGTHYYVRKDYDKAIENYELALSVNPSNVSILSMLGYSYLIKERYEKAAECYRNITYHDDSNFLAWNNLSKAYIKLNQKERAWRTLREAIKCNYEEWKIWENLMIVSIEIGALDDVITAWHRIIDIKSAHKDDQVLSALTYEIIKKPLNTGDSKNSQLLTEALKLVARLNSTSDCSPRLWMCYFKLLVREYQLLQLRSDGEPLTKLDIDSRISKITNALQRSNPTLVTVDREWFKFPEKVSQVLDAYEELVDCYIAAIEILGPRPEIWKQWKSFKLSHNNMKQTLVKSGYNLIK